MRRVLLAAGLPVLLPLLLAAPPVHAADVARSGDPGDAPFVGKAVTPGPSAQQPTVLTSGVYTIDLAAMSGREGYVAIDRTIPGSHFWYGLSVLDGQTPGASLFVTSLPDGADQSPCADYEGLGDDDDTGSSLATRLFWTGASPSCRSADRLELSIEDAMLPPGKAQLVLWEEPPVLDESVLPKPGAVTWTSLTPGAATVLAAGSSYSSAPVLPDGTFTVHVDPGAPTLFKVPLTWGQHEQVEASADVKSAKYARVIGRWITPLGGSIAPTTYNGGGPPDPQLTLDGLGDAAGWVTPVVAWKNRYAAKAAAAAFSGDYYLSIDTRRDSLPAAGVDLTLTAQTVTDFPAKPPGWTVPPPEVTYVDGTSETLEQATDPLRDPPSGEHVSRLHDVPAAVLLFVLSGAFAVAGVVALSRRPAR